MSVFTSKDSIASKLDDFFQAKPRDALFFKHIYRYYIFKLQRLKIKMFENAQDKIKSCSLNFYWTIKHYLVELNWRDWERNIEPLKKNC